MVGGGGHGGIQKGGGSCGRGVEKWQDEVLGSLIFWDQSPLPGFRSMMVQLPGYERVQMPEFVGEML